VHEERAFFRSPDGRVSEKKEDGFPGKERENVSWPLLRSARKSFFFFFTITNPFSKACHSNVS